MAESRHRTGILRISKRAMIDEVLRAFIPQELAELDPQVYYDFESDYFGFKFEHPSIPPHQDGELLPTIEVEFNEETGPTWKAVLRPTYADGYQDGRHDAESKRG